MKHTGLKRGTQRLKRTPLKVRGRKSAEKRERDFGERAVAVRRLLCVVCGATPCDPHHEPPRSLGGTSKDLVPLCHRHHLVRHQIGPTRFTERYHVDLLAEAARVDSGSNPL